jgi:hypothetical protein
MAVAPSGSERVTVTMPSELVAGTDPYKSNNSRFIAEAVRHELRRRRPLELVRSIDSPHPESLALAALGFKPGRSACLMATCRSCPRPPPGLEHRAWMAGRGMMRLARGTVVLVELEPTLGHEQRGTRPCVAASERLVGAFAYASLLL